MKFWPPLFLLLLALFSCQGRDIEKPTATNGVFDARSWNFAKDGLVDLRGQWEFFPGEFLRSQDMTTEKGLSKTLPGAWNSWKKDDGTPHGPEGFGTFHLKVLLPHGNGAWALKTGLQGSAYQVWVNGELLFASGTPAREISREIPAHHLDPKVFWSSKGEADIWILISNFHHVDGGLWSSIFLGRDHQVTQLRQSTQFLDLFLVGCFLIMSLYHLGLWLFLRRDRSTLFFALFACVMGLRLLLHGELAVLEIFPGIDWEWLNKLRHWTFYLAAPAFVFFIRELYYRIMARWPSWVFLGLSALGVLVVTLTPYRFFGDLLSFYQLLVLAQGSYLLWILGNALVRRMPGAGLLLMGFGFLFVTITMDILNYTWWLGDFPSVLPYGLLVFLFFQSAVLTRNFGKAFTDVESLSLRVQGINKALNRFVPKEFLHHLKKTSILDVGLGETTRSPMAVLFCDIRSFTRMSSQMSDQDAFALINAYLSRIGPVIRLHGGFVDKYIGDGIMALFPGGGYPALCAGLAMLEALKKYNSERVAKGREELIIGIGIHQGDLTLGTVGDNERMDTTVISSVVNLASRLEGLTKKYKAGIITTAEVIMTIPQEKGILFRHMGFEAIRGVPQPTAIFEVFNSDEPGVRDQKSASKAQFEDALVLLGQWKLDQAKKELNALKMEYPGDRGVTAFLSKIEHIQERKLLLRIRNRRRK